MKNLSNITATMMKSVTKSTNQKSQRDLDIK